MGILGGVGDRERIDERGRLVGRDAPLRDELHGYPEHVSHEFGLRRDIRLREVRTADYDEAGRTRRVGYRDADGADQVIEGNILISAVGAFNPPRPPGLDGCRPGGPPGRGDRHRGRRQATGAEDRRPGR